ncbi:molybdopterin cofactor-binding domain-containing protein [Sphingomonas sp. ID0503]|uniref:molybdopterin cofactor-binding domain-containing protein n=1 Tax=Sphingomonas sp. ID0503 TaxID=3399691 RepID=UPI003AFAB7A2
MAMRRGISRRDVLVAGGAGAGLVVAWTLWPRETLPNLTAAPGEQVLDAFLRIGADGRVIVAVPQAELGQGIWTALPQALADELGADWRTVAVEPAPIGPLYANDLILKENGAGDPGWLDGWRNRSRAQAAVKATVVATAGSTSIRSFEARFRHAGAVARTQLCRAAAARWGIDPAACDTADGFVVRGEDRLRFADLAEEAGRLDHPGDVELRKGGEGGLSGQPVPRLDLPGKVDGSARYAADVRLPGMVHAAVRMGPWGQTTLAGTTTKPADAIPGVLGIVENPGWVAAIANNWWAADRALAVIRPTFSTAGPMPDDAAIRRAFTLAFEEPGERVHERGEGADNLFGDGVVTAEYATGFAPHLTIEPLTATVRISGDRVEVWAPTQAPTALRAAVAAALATTPGLVTIYPVAAGGGFGRRLEHEAAVQAAVIARVTGKPVQLTWPRESESVRGRHRPPARARLSAKLGAGGAVDTLVARIAAPADGGLLARLAPEASGRSDAAEAVAGSVPAYGIPNLAVDHHAVDTGVPSGVGHGMAHGYTAFFTESFIDELAAKAGVDPFAFRMRMLTGQPRLARCLATVTQAGGWGGGGQGLACHSAFGSHIAMLAEARMEGEAIAVDRIVAAVDVGRVIHPDIVRQVIEGGIVYALGNALGRPVSYAGGLAKDRNFDTIWLPRLGDCPSIELTVLPSTEPPGGAGELGVPPVAPAIANALFAAAGKRIRQLPLGSAA